QTQVQVSTDVQGEVGRLVIENRGKQPILVLAGTLLKGGKQDRQIGQDFIIRPGASTPVDSYCVEHGRWTASREGKSTRGLFQAVPVLGTLSVRAQAQYEKDQNAVWEQVAEENRKAEKAPDSGTLLAAVEAAPTTDADRTALTRRQEVTRVLAERFAVLDRAAPRPVGIAYAVDGEVREVRFFNHPVIFRRYGEQLFATIAIEADLAAREAAEGWDAPEAERPVAADVAGLVREIAPARKEAAATEAGNVNVYQKAGGKAAARVYADEAAADAEAEPVTGAYSKY
ncbi:MAG: ARPP-1 family domain-containing protein, partial [Planctomycetota bacterium]